MGKLIEYGNGEEIQDGMMYKMLMELENFSAGAFKVNMKMEASV